jgi:hypothetical protein
MEAPYTFWFVAIKHVNFDMYLKHLDKYLDTTAGLLISQEIATKGIHKETDGEHLHIAAQITPEKYKLLHLNVHTQQLKLVLKAKDGIGKQVGKISPDKVRDETAFMTYCCKDDKVYTRNMDLKIVQEYISNSFKKKENWEDDIINYIKATYHVYPLCTPYIDDPREIFNYHMETSKLEHLVISYYIENSKKKSIPTRMSIKRLVARYLMYEIPECQGTRLTDIINNYIL